MLHWIWSGILGGMNHIYDERDRYLEKVARQALARGKRVQCKGCPHLTGLSKPEVTGCYCACHPYSNGQWLSEVWAAEYGSYASQQLGRPPEEEIAELQARAEGAS